MEEVADTFSDAASEDLGDLFASRLGSLSIAASASSRFDTAFTFDTSSRSSSLRHCESTSRSQVVALTTCSEPGGPLPQLLPAVVAPCHSHRRHVTALRRSSAATGPSNTAGDAHYDSHSAGGAPEHSNRSSASGWSPSSSAVRSGPAASGPDSGPLSALEAAVASTLPADVSVLPRGSSGGSASGAASPTASSVGACGIGYAGGAASTAFCLKRRSCPEPCLRLKPDAVDSGPKQWPEPPAPRWPPPAVATTSPSPSPSPTPAQASPSGHALPTSSATAIPTAAAGGAGLGGEPSGYSPVHTPAGSPSPTSSFASFAATLAAQYFAEYGAVPDVPKHIDAIRLRVGGGGKRQRLMGVEAAMADA
ncbi:hypothetical protein HYH03_002322 [Edaphochlamys debaryana]|uniref:Uncharacterized protein n=1 Tax=Edaphochlamys debaryana TaxID=47281 RepID=A0A835YBT1_9CHLO|nr:hypothetical protein HYH03_002322 [Edaphochlamys debaryana]|eukprot:KAG2500042.1 hypothetical protein HYH03_002322 [Edaphochlamys debaryana]